MLGIVFSAVLGLGAQIPLQNPLPSLPMLSNATSVSGLSSGAFMAVQMHVAYSREIIGAGVIAGGPFYCANANIITATHACMVSPALISVPQLVQITHNTALTGTIDPPSNLRDSRVWIFAGTKDTVIHPGVGAKLQDYYRSFVAAGGVKAELTVNAEHAVPTNGWGNPCSFLGVPYINNCGFDAVGELLQHIYDGELEPPTQNTSNSSQSSYMNFSQKPFLPIGYTLRTAGLAGTGMLLVPDACKENSTKLCRLHVALHGCLQGAGAVGGAFYQHAGYRSWAEANDIVVLFPQAIASTLANPNGCWDWWGYTGIQYASKLGVQMRAIMGMVHSLQN